MAEPRVLFDFFITLRGRECVVDVFSVVHAEPDVGIMTSYADALTVRDLESGATLELTEAEESAVLDKSVERIQESYVEDADFQ